MRGVLSDSFKSFPQERKTNRCQLMRKKKKKEGPRSVTRMREERRDLYDLLYGDEEPNNDDDDDDDDRGQVLPSKNMDPKMSNIFWDDENLDDFDPYGLDDF